MDIAHGVIEQSTRWVAAYLPSVYAGVCAFCISALIDIRLKQTTLKVATGAMICGISALATSSLLEYLGLPGNSGAFVGALLGFVGADHLRDIAISLITRRTGLLSDKDTRNKK
ncbi:phage holin family protein [Erwinia oleae]|uniref:phage holin family protein n=1 Tax=Erwinia oleae TaxID=796334 RepID=UPI000907C37E|nr:phage holin family protein [Erwinia oleae]